MGVVGCGALALLAQAGSGKCPGGDDKSVNDDKSKEKQILVETTALPAEKLAEIVNWIHSRNGFKTFF